MSKITENTLVPLSLMATILGAGAWLTVVWYQGNANATAIMEIKTEVKEKSNKLDDKLDEIVQRLSRIEGKLK